MLITPAYAQTATTQAGGLTATLVNFGPLVLIGVVMYWFLFRPQQIAQKTLRAQLAALKRGDRVVTAGGIVGTMKKAVEGATEVDVEIDWTACELNARVQGKVSGRQVVRGTRIKPEAIANS